MNDILIISNYFPPEMGAASNRIFQLAEGLTKSYNVTVLCPLPNYPTGKIFQDYKDLSKRKEVINSINVRRLWIYPSVSKNKFLRLFSMLSFGLSILSFFIKNRIPKTVIINSPPLLVAFISLLFLRSKKHKLILNVSDLWPKAGLELGAIKMGIGYKTLQKIEHFNYKKSHLILGQSEEILTHIKSIEPTKKTFLYRNYPNFSPPDFEINKTADTDKIKLVYAGLLGVAQGVLKLCKNLDFCNIELHIYGSGAEEEELKQFVRSNPNLPIILHGSIQREKLHKELFHYHVTIIPLLNRVYGSVPSKLFEYSRLGLPIIYFGGGEGEIIIENNNLGWIAEAGNYEALNTLISRLDISDFNSDRSETIKKTALKVFDSKKQLKELNEFIQ